MSDQTPPDLFETVIAEEPNRTEILFRSSDPAHEPYTCIGVVVRRQASGDVTLKAGPAHINTGVVTSVDCQFGGFTVEATTRKPLSAEDHAPAARILARAAFALSELRHQTPPGS